MYVARVSDAGDVTDHYFMSRTIYLHMTHKWSLYIIQLQKRDF